MVLVYLEGRNREFIFGVYREKTMESRTESQGTLENVVSWKERKSVLRRRNESSKIKTEK